MYQWWVLFAVSFLLLIVNVDFTVANLALPAISQEFHIGLAYVKWVITAYAISAGIFMVIGGRLGDIYGMKPIFLLGIAIFTLFSLLCAISPWPWFLMVSRFLQGIGTALAFPLAFALLATSFEEGKRGMAMGLANTIAGATLAIGPTIGGVILHYLSWRWIFFVNVPFGICAFVIAWAVLKKGGRQERCKFDLKGSLLMLIGVVCVMLAINQIAIWGWIAFWILVVIGLIILAFFVLSQLRSDHPLVHVELLTHGRYLDLTVIRIGLQYIFFGLLIVLALYLQNVLGHNALITGLLLLILTGVYSVSAPLTGYFLRALGVKPGLIIALGFSIAGSLILIFGPLVPGLGYFVLPFICFGLSLGLMTTITETEALGCFDESMTASAAGLFFTLMILGGSVGAAITSYNLTDVSSSLVSVNGNVLKAAEGSYPIRMLSKELQVIAEHAFRHAFNVIQWIYVAVALGAVVLTVMLPRKKNEA